MRGKVSPGSSERRACGITPAYAGKSREVLINVPGSGDHPRICGEKVMIPASMAFITGSPPHMRGKADAEAGIAEFLGITPAYAGKSFQTRLESESSSGITPAYAGKSPEGAAALT